jgi:hypothetical protein
MGAEAALARAINPASAALAAPTSSIESPSSTAFAPLRALLSSAAITVAYRAASRDCSSETLARKSLVRALVPLQNALMTRSFGRLTVRAPAAIV